MLFRSQTQLGLHFVPFPGPSSSGDEVFGERVRPLRGLQETRVATREESGVLAQTWLGMCFVPFPGPSSSGDKVFGEHSR